MSEATTTSPAPAVTATATAPTVDTTGRLRLAAGLVGSGLAIEAVTLFWIHPTSFLICVMASGALVGAGVLVYLLALLKG